ncbi:hypothetical protein Fcan01_07514 [Folsomia candida]|uniref:GOST seven transmembrane domain-containing protein n=1 Tax=Folsomia candida TaxID=158441 RepID=A0A226ELF0_FOLCA|nr:hypothetical protein Fcan01_07514 [Folsomia candida]
MSSKLRSVLCFCILLVSPVIHGRKHHLKLENDERRLIHITTFGFLKGGSLEVNLRQFSIKPVIMKEYPIGFTVDRTLNNGINPYSQNMDSTCSDFDTSNESVANIRFQMDLKGNATKVVCSSELQSHVKVCKTSACVPKRPAVIRAEMEIPNVMTQKQKRSVNDDNANVPSTEVQSASAAPAVASSSSSPKVQNGQDSQSSSQAKDADIPETGAGILTEGQGNSCNNRRLPLNVTIMPDGTLSYSFNFVVYIAAEDCEGLYSLYFHNCAPDDRDSRVTLDMKIIESNQDDSLLGQNYLSAGETPLPALYLMMSILFFIAGCFWVLILRKSSREVGVTVYKLHYLMGSLVFVKSLSLLFHSINYHYIQNNGFHAEGWAVLYYITHLLKGALLFLTILLIGTGYAFVKHLLSDKEKKVLANVAQIIIEESEEGEVVHTTWKVIFISVDLLCCGAILFPVVWSIRHLQEASQTDGKAQASLKKLKLFRHFYIMIVAYIYFTRIIVQMLLRITVPFQYEWVDDMFLEMTTFIFFVITGYKFRPTRNNPYLELVDSDDDCEMDTALTESGLTAGLSKRGFKPKKKTLKEIVLFDPNEDGSDDDDEEVLLEKREASHDFD